MAGRQEAKTNGEGKGKNGRASGGKGDKAHGCSREPSTSRQSEVTAEKMIPPLERRPY